MIKLVLQQEERYIYSENALNARSVQLTSISEMQDEDEENSEEEENKETDTKENCTYGMSEETQHMLLEPTNSVGNSLPPDLSPRYGYIRHVYHS